MKGRQLPCQFRAVEDYRKRKLAFCLLANRQVVDYWRFARNGSGKSPQKRPNCHPSGGSKDV